VKNEKVRFFLWFLVLERVDFGEPVGGGRVVKFSGCCIIVNCATNNTRPYPVTPEGLIGRSPGKSGNNPQRRCAIVQMDKNVLIAGVQRFFVLLRGYVR
jgi:hypothetical protein